MNPLKWPHDLNRDYFSYALNHYHRTSTLLPSAQSIILFAVVNLPDQTQAVLPSYKYREVGGKESLISREWANNDSTGREDEAFRSAPQAVQISWHPYGTFEVRKVKKVLEEHIQERFLRPNIVTRTVQYEWHLSWSRDCAKKIMADIELFASRVRMRLQNKLQFEAKKKPDCIRIVQHRIEYIRNRCEDYISFKDESLVDLKDGIQVLGCAEAVFRSLDNPAEWKKVEWPHYEVTPFYGGQICCILIRLQADTREQW